MNQTTTGSTSSPPPKVVANRTAMVIPNSTRNSLIDLAGGEDASVSNGLMNGGDMDGGGANNDSALVPKSCSDSTENDAAMAGGDITRKNPSDSARELVIPPKLVAQSKDDSTGDEEMAGDNMTGGVVNKGGPALVLKSVSDSTATDDDMARLNTKIMDAQHLIDTSTGVALDLAQEDLLQLQQLLEGKKDDDSKW